MRKVVVIGGSSGAIPNLCAILKALPENLDAPVLVVIHTTQESRDLPKVLQRCGNRVVIAAEKAEAIAAGKVYVAAPNRHLVVKSQCAISRMGPRENRHRPCVDALFRSAARDFRAHVIAVVLSGALDDGTVGALAVKARGGTVIVQDPADAFAKDMPENVLRQVKADYCIPSKTIPSIIAELASKGPAIKRRAPTPKQCEAISKAAFSEMEPPGFTCPECGGVVMKVQNGKRTEFRCHVGHAFSLDSFTEAHADALERALWVALRKLNEQHSLQSSLAHDGNGSDILKKRHQENADAAKHDMRLLHEILSRL